MSKETTSKANAFSQIRSRDDAIRIARECGVGFFAFAGIQGVIGIWLGPAVLIDAAIFAICGYFIRKSFSRTAAVIAVVMSLGSLIATIMNMTGAPVAGGTNIILAFIVVFTAVRSVEATFKLHGRYKETADVG